MRVRDWAILWIVGIVVVGLADRMTLVPHGGTIVFWTFAAVLAIVGRVERLRAEARTRAGRPD